MEEKNQLFSLSSSGLELKSWQDGDLDWSAGHSLKESLSFHKWGLNVDDVNKQFSKGALKVAPSIKRLVDILVDFLLGLHRRFAIWNH